MVKTIPIKKNKEFLRVYKKGRFFVGRLMVLYIMPNHLEINRIGIAASKKIGKSVTRNRIRRLIRENYRLYESFIREGFDCVFNAREFDNMPDFQDIGKEMKFLLKKLGIFDREKWDCLKGC